jgi:tetratricopeptide (TPR) repeat protein
MELREREEFTMFADSQRSSRDARKGTLTFDAFVGGKPAAKEDNVEVLAKQLEGAKRIVPAEPEIATPAEPVIEARRPVRIVTATLAEIYASQGEYQEAINAYRKLQEQHPEDAPRYVKRIAQLEESLRRQQPDEK